MAKPHELPGLYCLSARNTRSGTRMTLASLSGALSFDATKPAFTRKAIEALTEARLFALSYDFVGDLAEAVALV